MKINSISVKRIIGAVAILIVMLCGIFVLSRPCSGITETKSELPAIGSSPVYVEMEDGVTTIRKMSLSEDRHISALELLLVHTTGDSKSALLTEVTSASGEIIYSDKKLIAEFVVGDWTKVAADIYLNAGEEYTFAFTPIGCSPYFMQIEGYDLDISMGFDYVTDKKVTYGDIFYYSIPIIALAGILLAGLLLFGSERILAAVRKLAFEDIIRRFGTEAFLILLFVTLSLKIYSTAYVKGVYITADSDGYLREAVNLVAGNGFAYDGIAGYESWFANWPIIYPALIAGIMLITGTNAYLASKIVAIICIAVIEIILYIAFKKDAWVYALALTNAGVLSMAYNTWSEIPFMVFMLIFGLALGRIVSEEKANISNYVILGVAGTATYLTRYFGIFVWCVAGIYWLLILINWWKSAGEGKCSIKEHMSLGNKLFLSKLIRLAVTAFMSGVIYVLYLMMNKIKNGNPTGVSRGTWWDDYKTLTDDLVKSLVAEIFNIFSLDIPKTLNDMPVYLQLWFVLAFILLITLLIHRCLKGRGNVITRYMSVECVLIIMAVVYYAMFIVIRYRSSMDTFYFRFFAPATFLLVIGVIGLVLKTFDVSRAGRYLAFFVTVIISATFVEQAGGTDFSHSHDYYDITINSWSEIYSEIPERSVVIWSDLDYRSTWYRADVIAGELFGDDTPDTLKVRYYGSENMCIRADYAETILAEGEYDAELKAYIQEALDSAKEGTTYLSISLR